jgi:carboxyl-terminal processing protease
MIAKFRRAHLFLLTAIFLGMALGVSLYRSLESQDDLYNNLDTFSDALTIIKNNYIKDPQPRELLYGALKGMVEALDAHSSFMPPRAFSEMEIETQGEFGGVGIEITVRDNWITVVSPIDDTPAYRAGIRSGDRIVAVDGVGTQGMSLSDVVDKIRGPVGTVVTLTIQRPEMKDGQVVWGEPFDVKLVRAKVVVKSVKPNLLEDGKILYIRITQFQAHTSEDLQDVLKKYNTGDKIGIILDLRNNSGGLLDQAIKVSDLFLKSGLIVKLSGRSPQMNQSWSASDDGVEPQVPMVVLINSGTASASEIVAGALKDHKRAVLIGTRSFGKGSVQTIYRLRDGSGLRLTTAVYYTPSGKSIQAEGIQPDIVVEEFPDEDQLATREEELDHHLKVGKEGIDIFRKEEEKVPSRAPRPKRSVPGREGRGILEEGVDRALERAVDLLKGLAILQASGVSPRPATAGVQSEASPPSR